MILDTAKGHIILISDEKEVNCNISPKLWQQQYNWCQIVENYL